jgi:mannosyl-oligosaccharide alpha-1,3-glucosidase
MTRRVSWLCVLLCVLACTSTCVCAIEVMKLPSGQTVFVTLFRDNILRVKVQPTTGEFYRVSDVVVAEKEPAEKFSMSCQSSTSCTVTTAKATMNINGLLLDSDDAVLMIDYFTLGGTSTVTKIPVSSKYLDAPEITTTFPRANKLFGLPQHAMDLVLKEDVTYQLYNLDVFHYKLDDPGGIYGSIPFMMAHGTEHTVGVLFLNSAEMNVRIQKSFEESDGLPSAHWKAEVGIVDVFFMGGANPHQVHEMHAYITGKAYLQCSPLDTTNVDGTTEAQTTVLTLTLASISTIFRTTSCGSILSTRTERSTSHGTLTISQSPQSSLTQSLPRAARW